MSEMPESPSQEAVNAYEREIEPLVARLASLCAARGLPMFFTVQEGEESFRTTSTHLDRSKWSKLRWMRMMNESWKLDDFLEQVIIEAVTRGHDSLYLQAMGIPMKPGSNKFPTQWVRRPGRGKES